MPAASPFAASSQQRTVKQPDDGFWLNGKPVIYALITVFMTATATQFPMLPFLFSDLGGTPVQYAGLMMSLFGGLQLIGNLLSGPILDTVGARGFYAVSFVATGVMALITALATSVWMLFVSKLPAVLELAPLCARVLITERSSETARARLLGYIGVSIGIGIVVGPTIGGVLSENKRYQLCAWVAAGMTFLAALFIPLIPPVTSHSYTRFSDAPDTPRAPSSESSNEAAAAAPGSIVGRKASLHLRQRNDSHEDGKGLPLKAQTSKGLSASADRASKEAWDRPSQLGAHSQRVQSQIVDDATANPVTGHLVAEAGAHAKGPSPPEPQRQHLELEAAEEAREQGGEEHRKVPRMTQIWTTFMQPGVPSIIWVKVLIGLGQAMLQTSVSFLLSQHYHLSTQAAGGFISYMGCLVIVVQATVIGPISKHFSVHAVVVSTGWGIVLLFGGIALPLASSNVWVLGAFVGPLICLVIILEVICTAQLTKITPTSCRGTALALDSAIMGALTLVAPSAATSLYALVGFSSLGVAGASAAVLLMLLLHTGVLAV